MSVEWPTGGTELSRRQLLVRTGWVVPVIMGVTLSENAFANYGRDDFDDDDDDGDDDDDD